MKETIQTLTEKVKSGDTIVEFGLNGKISRQYEVKSVEKWVHMHHVHMFCGQSILCYDKGLTIDILTRE